MLEGVSRGVNRGVRGGVRVAAEPSLSRCETT